MGSRKICGVAGEFTMLVSLGDTCRSQQGSGPRPQLAIAACDSPVFAVVVVTVSERAGGKRLPARTFAERANLHPCPCHLQPGFFNPSKFHRDSIQPFVNRTN